MTDRERLLEILNVPIYPHENVDPLEAVADYLLDNGVTFKSWISVTEQPKKTGKYLVSVDGFSNAETAYYYSKFERWGYTSGAVTHWMPLPEPPKEK